MRTYRCVVIALLGACQPNGGSDAGEADLGTQNAFVGTWRLASWESRSDNGEIVYPYGENAQGRLIYDLDGHMAAQLMRPDRAPPGDNASPEQRLAIVAGFFAYYGTYTIDETERTVTHHVEGSIAPDWIGTDRTRAYEFSGGNLVLRPVEGSSVLTWERVGGFQR